MRFGILLCGLGMFGSACDAGPCIPVGEYEFFARQATRAGELDGGFANCPVEILGALTVRSSTSAHFAMDGGFGGDCTLSPVDYRPRYACQVAMNCSGSSSIALQSFSFTTYSFVGPDPQAFIVGMGGTKGITPDMQWRSGGCEATYSWAAAQRSRP